MEHRWGERVGVDLPVRITAHPFVVRHGRITNLSVSGGSIVTDFEMRNLSRIQVAIEIPTRARSEALNIAAYVTRTSKDSVGVEWCQFAPRAITELLQSLSNRPPARLRKSESAPGAVISPPLLKHGS